jgi:predicted amidohydrolase
MANHLDVACVQVASLGTDLSMRRENAVRLVHEAAGADLIALRELWPVDYFAFDDYGNAAEPLDRPTVAAMSHAARAVGAHVVLGSFVERSEHGLHNTAAVVSPSGAVLARTARCTFSVVARVKLS